MVVNSAVRTWVCVSVPGKTHCLTFIAPPPVVLPGPGDRLANDFASRVANRNDYLSFSFHLVVKQSIVPTPGEIMVPSSLAGSLSRRPIAPPSAVTDTFNFIFRDGDGVAARSQDADHLGDGNDGGALR